MERVIEKAESMLKAWKGDSYTFGFEVLNRVGDYAAGYGNRALVIAAGLGEPWSAGILQTVTDSLTKKGVEFETVQGANPNAPREDLYRLAWHVARMMPHAIIAVGGGSTIDAAKAANVLGAYSPLQVRTVLQVPESLAGSIDPYFGVGNVARIAAVTKKALLPLIAVQTAASSAAHLTKYSNITDISTGQKKLIVDETIVPRAAVFDYGITRNAPQDLTLDGGLDGIAHAWEVFMGATGQGNYGQIKEVAAACLELTLDGLRKVKTDNRDGKARLLLGLGTDLGGYAIMLGGTNGPHLGSFSLIDALSHGRACAILNPYYTVLFAPKIEDQLTTFAAILKKAGFLQAKVEGKKGRGLGVLVARAMIQLFQSLGFPATLAAAGVSKAHLKRMVQAAKDPQLKMKLQNMPAPMDVERGDIDRLMKPTLEAAFTGDLNSIPEA